MATKYYTDDEIAAARAARNAPGNHYSDGRRFSRINNAWIFVEDWNDAEEIATLRAEIARLEKDAARFNWCQNNPKLAQAMFWNYQSRKQRAEAIDAAITAAKNGEVPTE
jgi:hypothetical protein